MASNKSQVKFEEGGNLPIWKGSSNEVHDGQVLCMFSMMANRICVGSNCVEDRSYGEHLLTAISSFLCKYFFPTASFFNILE